MYPNHKGKKKLGLILRDKKVTSNIHYKTMIFRNKSFLNCLSKYLKNNYYKSYKIADLNGCEKIDKLNNNSLCIYVMTS